MISLEFQDASENRLSDVNLGNVFPGYESPYQSFRLVNTGNVDVVAEVYADESYQQNGTPRETYQAAWFSLNNFNYAGRVYAPIPAGDFVEIYMKWRPVDVARTGDKQWRVKWNVEPVNTEDICDKTT